MKSLFEQHKFQFVRFCDAYHAEPTIRLIPHINDDYHIHHIIKGNGLFIIHDKTYSVSSGAVVAVPPYVHFKVRIDSDDFRMINIHSRIWDAYDQAIDRLWILPFVFTPEYFVHTATRLEELCALDSEAPEGRAGTAALAHEIVLEHWLRTPLLSSRPEIIDPRIEKLHDMLISAKCLRSRYDAKALAQTCHLSVSQMNRLFRRTFASSPKQYWEERRLSEIRLFLKTNADARIVEVANEFGFENQSYFSSWFKNLAGQCPFAYRDALMKSTEQQGN